MASSWNERIYLLIQQWFSQKSRFVENYYISREIDFIFIIFFCSFVYVRFAPTVVMYETVDNGNNWADELKNNL